MTPCVRELRIVYSSVETVGPRPKVGRPADAAAVLQQRLEHEPIEVGVVLLLDTKHRLIAVHEISRGSLDAWRTRPTREAARS